MDYEKKYKEALKRAKFIHSLLKDSEDSKNYSYVESMEDIFPELAESKDEKTKRLLHTIANKMSQHLRDIFTEEEFQCFDAWSNAWLEKQGDKKPILDVEIPFGAKDSELEEVSYDIPKGYHAEIEDNKVVIKKGEQKSAEWSEEIEAAISLLKDIAEEQEKDYCPHNANDLRKAAIYLETCRSQSTLKPSDKHYELEEFARVVRGNLTGISKTVQKLFEAKYLQLTGRKMYIGFKD